MNGGTRPMSAAQLAAENELERLRCAGANVRSLAAMLDNRLNREQAYSGAQVAAMIREALS